MARDNHIIRTDRLTRPPKAAIRKLTREERVTLLVQHILPDVRAALDAKRPSTSKHGKR